jgi:AraC-like DNA-binding protein
VLRERRWFDAPELDASSSGVELRTPFVRFCVQNARNVSTDWGVVERAIPFVHRMSRPALTIVLEGRGRFDEGGRHFETREGQVALMDQRRMGTEAYAGARSRVLAIEWDPRVLGGQRDGAVEIARIDPRALRTLARASATLESAPSDAIAGGAAVEIVEQLRAIGLPFERLEAGALHRAGDADEQRLATALGEAMSRLREHPDLEDVSAELGWNHRLVHRRVALMVERYGIPWDGWRAMIRSFRLTTALRLLSAPGATTERVAQLTGFRSPSALCHTFDKAGLPSPGRFVREARRDALEGWAPFAADSRPDARARGVGGR